MKGSLADLGTRRAVRHSHQLIRKCHTPGSTFHVARSRMCIATQASADDSQWWSSMSKRTPQGPVPAMPPPPPSSIEEINKEIMGERGYARYERVKRDERQRVWDNMRRIARQRFDRGQMPSWFDPRILDIEEAPVNTYWREKGLEAYQYDDSWLGTSSSAGDGSSGGSSGGSGGGGGGWRWWREEDPYWPLRDWGDHPMRWWTFGFAALLAAGGLGSYLFHGSLESLQTGLTCGAVLSICAAAMSDIKTGWYGELAVKAAWATCLAISAKEYFHGWQHQRGRRAMREPALGGCGAAAAAMCVLYMVTGMSGLASVAFPMNPGAAFKLEDVAKKHKVWEDWGYGDLTMRQ